MAETKRKLTTILSADVQDYTRLMGADEEGTLATLKRYRDRMSGVIQLHGGRVINTWGDGLIAEFPSVVEAVRAAIDVQNEIAQANSDKPRDNRMQFRIGINLGDVIEQDNDLYGDGVNIAARLQSQAVPGGIVISNTVYDHVRNKLSVAFDFLGDLSVKNVHDAIPSYSVRVGDAMGAVHATRDTAAPEMARHPSRSPDFGRGEQVSVPMGVDGLFGFRSAFLTSLAIPAGILTLINIFTWHGEFWAAWPLLFIGTTAALVWSRNQSGPVRRYGPAVVVSAMLLGINLLGNPNEMWAQWPILGIAIASAIQWATLRSRRS